MIFKTPRRKLPFTQIDNELINNAKLTGKAKWILIHLLSKPPDWLVYEKDIVNHVHDGRDAIRTGIHELITAGYLQRQVMRSKEGQWQGYLYDVSETPVFITNHTEDGFSGAGKPDTSNKDLTNREKEHTSMRGSHGLSGHQLQRTYNLATIENANPKDQPND